MIATNRYDPNLLDDSDYDGMSEGERAAAEAMMRKRDREEGRMDGRMRRGLLVRSLFPFLSYLSRNPSSSQLMVGWLLSEQI